METLTIHQGDCLTILPTIPSRSVDVIFADPPYRTGSRADKAMTYTSSAALAAQDWHSFHADWDDDWPTMADYAAWATTWLRACQRILKPKGSIFICGTHHGIPGIGMALDALGFYTVQWISWYKRNAMPNRAMVNLAASTEIVIWARPSQQVPHIYQKDVARWYGKGKNLRDMWDIPFDSATAKRLKAIGVEHPSKKPMALVERCLRLAAPQQDAVILDMFAGSGTTGEVVMRVGNGWRGILIERDAAYVSMMDRRFAQPVAQVMAFGVG